MKKDTPKKIVRNKSAKVLLGAATLLAAGLVGEKVQAANTAVSMSAKIIQPISITKRDTLDFGTLTVKAGSGGTVKVTNLGARTATGGVSLVGGATGTAGSFDLKGATAIPIDVSITKKTWTVSNGTANMNVNNFTIEGAAGTIKSTPYTHSLAAATETDFKVGATLNVTAGQAVGTYTGTVTLVATYQ